MCLAGNSQIHTSVGLRTIKELSELFEFDNSSLSSLKVLTVDTKTDIISETKIKRVWNTGIKKVYKLKFSGNLHRPESEFDTIKFLEVTDNHPILMADGNYKSLKDGLVVGDLVWGGFEVATSEGELKYLNNNVKLISITELEEQKVYDLEVESENHNFLVNEIFVHNCEFKFHIKLPIFVARQWIRHRTACLSGDTTVTVLIEDGGTWVNVLPIKELYEQFKKKPYLNIKNFKEDTSEIQYAKVLDIYESGVKEVYEWVFENSIKIKCTKDHLVFTTAGWMTMGNLFENKYTVKVHSVESHYVKTQSSLLECNYIGEEMTYDITMGGDFQNFYANDIVVHNSVNEYSGRYSEMKDEFYIPPTERLTTQSSLNKQGSSIIQIDNPDLVYEQLVEHSKQSYDLYKNLLDDQNLSRELSRTTLPVSNYTEWYWKINLHNLLNLLRLRADSHAQQEIVEYANAIIELIKDIVPLTYEAFEDYRLHSMNLSRMEKDLLGDFLKEVDTTKLMDMFDNSETLEKYRLSKREITEFKDKISKMII
jgi:thymidylate synthase ThyX